MNPIAVWHRQVQERNSDGLSTLLDDDAVFVSPVVHTPQRGKQLSMYLRAAIQVFGNPTFRYVREIIGPSDAMLEFETEIEAMSRSLLNR